MQQRVTNHQLLSVADAETATGISRWTWRRWAYEGRISSVKLGKRLMLSQVELDRVIAEGTRPRLQDAHK
jgi:predicted site-specific integrase-resolvase